MKKIKNQRLIITLVILLLISTLAGCGETSGGAYDNEYKEEISGNLGDSIFEEEQNGKGESSDENNTPYANNTNFCSMMLTTALNQDYKSMELRLNNIDKINFYQLFPLYKEELDYKQTTDAETLLSLFGDNDILPVININRRNYGIM